MNKDQKREALKAELSEIFAPFQRQIDKIMRQPFQMEIQMGNRKFTVASTLEQVLKEGREGYAELREHWTFFDNDIDAAINRAKHDTRIVACDKVIDALIYREGQPESQEPWALKIKDIRRQMFERLLDATPNLYESGMLTGLTDEEEAQKIIKKGDDQHRLDIKGRIAVVDMPEIGGTGFSIWAFPIKPKERLMLHSHHIECLTFVAGDPAINQVLQKPAEEEVYDARPDNPIATLVSGNLRYPGSAVINHPKTANGHIIRNPNDEQGILTLHLCGFSPRYGILFDHEKWMGLIGPVTATYEGPEVAGTIRRAGREYFLGLGNMKDEPQPPAWKRDNLRENGKGPIEPIDGKPRSISHRVNSKKEDGLGGIC